MDSNFTFSARKRWVSEGAPGIAGGSSNAGIAVGILLRRRTADASFSTNLSALCGAPRENVHDRSDYRRNRVYWAAAYPPSGPARRRVRGDGHHPQTANFSELTKVKVLRGDISQFDDVMAVMTSVKPDRVVSRHSAGVEGPITSERSASEPERSHVWPQAAEPTGPHREGEEPKPMMHGHEKSDSAIVAMKPPNKAGRPATEAVERRAEAKENANRCHTCRTQCRESVSQVPERARKAARLRGAPSNGRPYRNRQIGNALRRRTRPTLAMLVAIDADCRVDFGSTIYITSGTPKGSRDWVSARSG